MSKIHKPHCDPRRRSLLLLARVLRALHRLRVATFADWLLCDRAICSALYDQLPLAMAHSCSKKIIMVELFS